MVKIITNIKWMGGINIIPGTISCRFVGGFIKKKLYHRRLTKRMVQYHVENNSHTTAMAFINKVLQSCLGAIVFISCKIKGRVITPAQIGFKFVDRHQLNGINS
ncbi:hypothetical protein D3C73_1381140 [compost metagenome]